MFRLIHILNVAKLLLDELKCSEFDFYIICVLESEYCLDKHFLEYLLDCKLLKLVVLL